MFPGPRRENRFIAMNAFLGPMRYLGVFGHVNIDHILTLDRLPSPGKSQEVSSRIQRLGGTAGNIIVYSAALGIPTSIATFVGADFPPEFRERLENLGIDLTDLVEVDGGNTPQVWVLSDPQQEQMYFIDQGVFLDLNEREVLEHTVKNSEWIHISTGRPGYYTKVTKLAKDLGKKVALDPGQEIHFLYDEEKMKAIVQYADAFFGNTMEADVAVKLLGKSNRQDLLDFVDLAVITDGKEGSVIYTKEGPVHHIPALDVKDKGDATGAGDAYRAGFYAGLMKGFKIEECGHIGAAAASIVVGRERPLEEPPGWEEVAELAGL